MESPTHLPPYLPQFREGSVCWRNQVSFIDCSVFSPVSVRRLLLSKNIKYTFLHIKEMKKERKMRILEGTCKHSRVSRKKSSSYWEFGSEIKRRFYLGAKNIFSFMFLFLNLIDCWSYLMEKTHRLIRFCRWFLKDKKYFGLINWVLYSAKLRHLRYTQIFLRETTQRLEFWPKFSLSLVYLFRKK